MHARSITPSMQADRAPTGSPLASRAWSPIDRAARGFVARVLGSVRWGRIELRDSLGVLRSEGSKLPGRGDDSQVTTVHVHDPRFYRGALLGGSSAVGKAFIEGWWTCDDPARLVEIMCVNEEALRSLDAKALALLGPLRRLRYWSERNTRSGSRRNIASHYDLSNEFYRLWLDPTMTYSCGYFATPDATLHEAQVEKIDMVCRKLGLGPEHHLLEIGTGWGALAVHAAERYGCRVTTTTISQRQFDHATELVRERGLSERITVLLTDYRDLPRTTASGSFDRLVSIEMIEAVGRENLGRFFAVCDRMLKPDGLMMLQAITILDRRFEHAARNQDFLKRYIFPGSCLLSVGALVGAMAGGTRLQVRDVQDIGPHYVRTLRLWRDRFHACLPSVRALGFDERFIRMWTFYLCYCEGAFAARTVSDVQMLIAREHHRAALPSSGPTA